MNEISNYVKRDHALKLLQDHLDQIKGQIVPAGENHAYELGKHLGYCDAIEAAMTILRDCPAEQMPASDRRAWHHA